MSKRLLTFACVAALMAAACGKIPQGTVNPGSGARFVTQVADSVDDVGLGNRVTIDKDGMPWISYWGFPAKPKGNEIPVTRPIGAPYIPAVQVANLAKSGIWTRGAAAQVPNTLQGIVVPYGPATVEQLKNANSSDTNGTDIAIAPDGIKHVVWASSDGIYYAGGSASFTVTKLYAVSELSVAGPLGRPSVAVDAAGKPWVAYTVNAAAQEVRVASPDAAGKWQTTVVASLPQCGGCPQPGSTRIGITPAGPVIAYANGKAKTLMVGTLSAGAWTTRQVASGVTAGGLAMAVGKDGAVYLTYYAGDGTVQLASDHGGAWSTTKVADAAPPAKDLPGNLSETTGVAVDDNAKIYVTWYDAKANAIRIASGDGSSFAPIQGTDTDGGAYPSIAVAHDGSLLYVSWYASQNQDLLLGVWGNQRAYDIAYPSPTPPPGPPPPPSGGATCGTDKKVALSEVAKGTAFASTCLVAPAGKAFSINFDNQDPFASTGPHNIAVASDSAFTTVLFSGDLVNGPATTVYQVTQKSGPLKAGTYYFHCIVHPVMTGTLAVVAGAK